MDNITKNVKKLIINNSMVINCINDKYTLQEEDFILKKEITYDGNLWKSKVLAEFNLYLPLLGLIDTLISVYDNYLFHAEIENDIKEIKFIKKIKAKILGYREQLKNDIINDASFINELDSLDEIIETIPCYDKINKMLCEKEEDYNYMLYKKFSDSYFFGYCTVGNVDFNSLFKTYTKQKKLISSSERDNEKYIKKLQRKY